MKKAKKKFFKKINPCTKTFQALRIFVNKEITELINGIIKATKKLKPGGKILVVTFHSIEDRIVKYFFLIFQLINLDLQDIFLKVPTMKTHYLIIIEIKH